MESKEKQRELFQEYIAKMRPVLNKRALFSDETEQFRTCRLSRIRRCQW